MKCEGALADLRGCLPRHPGSKPTTTLKTKIAVTTPVMCK